MRAYSSKSIAISFLLLAVSILLLNTCSSEAPEEFVKTPIESIAKASQQLSTQLDSTRYQLQIGNDGYFLDITSALNESQTLVDSVKNAQGALLSLHYFYDIEYRLTLHNEVDTLLQKQIIKTDLPNSITAELLSRSVINEIEYVSIRSNRLYLDLELRPALGGTSTWLSFGIFYRGPKKGRIDFMPSRQK